MSLCKKILLDKRQKVSLNIGVFYFIWMKTMFVKPTSTVAETAKLLHGKTLLLSLEDDYISATISSVTIKDEGSHIRISNLCVFSPGLPGIDSQNYTALLWFQNEDSFHPLCNGEMLKVKVNQIVYTAQLLD
jgi:hypothetical protein